MKASNTSFLNIKDIRVAGFINDRSLGIFSKKKIDDYDDVFFKLVKPGCALPY